MAVDGWFDLKISCWPCLPRDFGASCFSIPLSLKTRHVRAAAMRDIEDISQL